MRVDIVSAMSSISAFLTDLKRIQTPHSLFWGFGADKTFTTRWSGGTVQVWVQVQAPAGHLAISLKAVPEGNWRFRGQNQLPSSWGSSPALLARVGLASTNTGRFRVGCSFRVGSWTEEHKHRAFPSWLPCHSVLICWNFQFFPDFLKIQKNWRPRKRLFESKAHAQGWPVLGVAITAGHWK